MAHLAKISSQSLQKKKKKHCILILKEGLKFMAENK